MIPIDWELVAETHVKQINRLLVIMPHTGETCKHQGSICKHINLYHFCACPVKPEEVSCEDNMPCFNGQWELKD